MGKVGNSFRVMLCVALLALSVMQVFAKGANNVKIRERIDLSGVWQSSLGECMLPGTTDENHLGDRNRDTTRTSELTRLWRYEGPVIYSREVEIPESMRGKRLTLIMERTKPSTLWIDDDSIGSFSHIFIPHVYELPSLEPGKHSIKICVDNSSYLVPPEVRGSHAWTDATQTNWNGILGTFCIEATPSSFIKEVQAYGNPTQGSVVVRTLVHTSSGKDSLYVNAVSLGKKAQLWSEFHPALYNVCAQLVDDKVFVEINPSSKRIKKRKKATDCLVTTIGLRQFSVDGTKIAINGMRTFLRGKHDGCAFPLTGYCPTDVEAWRRYFSTCRAYGINHVRFHSYTPTEAAFQAADEAGMYLQVELPCWGTIDSTKTELNSFLLREAHDVLRTFGNHPSFMSLGLGNELWGDTDLMRTWLDEFRAIDKRHLYLMGSNNTLGYQSPTEGEDYIVTCRLGGGANYETNTRSSFSFADEDEGGLLNNTQPNTRADYSEAISRCPIPVVGHENGQFQVYPDYEELPKYTGVLYPYNLEVFRERIRKAGMEHQVKDFHNASGKWAVECYKADIEYSLRTAGMGGFQLLDLQDYPGQGTALVGILDAFMDSKGLVTPAEWTRFCSPVVLLAALDSMCYSAKDTLSFDVMVANYQEKAFEHTVSWNVSGNDFRQSGKFSGIAVEQGRTAKIGSASVPLSEITSPTELTLTLQSGAYSNEWKVWVYPSLTDKNVSKISDLLGLLALAPSATLSSGGVTVCGDLSTALGSLNEGEKVLLLPRKDSISNVSVGGLFTPDYWNYAMFRSISLNNRKPVSPGTLGLLMNPTHPLFENFPTEEHTNWQWWQIVRNSNPMILDRMPDDYLPLIQAIDNVERNHKLGLLFELCVDVKGQDAPSKLLVCTSRLDEIQETPSGKAFFNSIFEYMRSDSFAPQTVVTPVELVSLFTDAVSERNIVGVKNLTDYSAP